MAWLASGPRAGVLLPCSDEALEFVAMHRSDIERFGYRAVEADDEVLLAMLDKDRTYALAREIGVDSPRTLTIRDPDDLLPAAEQVGYPCALKPLHSHRFARHFKTKVLLVEHPEDLRRHFDCLRDLGLEMMLTEIVPGPDTRYCSYYSYLDEDGQPLFHFTAQAPAVPEGLRSHLPPSNHWDPEVAELGLRFFRSVKLRGIGNVEFKRDVRDGRLRLIECNARFTAANELVRRARIDLPLIAYERAMGRAGPSPEAYQQNMYMWHPLKDIRAFVEYHRTGELTFAQWLSGLIHKQHFPVFSWKDPVPTVATHAWRVSRSLRGGTTAPGRGSIEGGTERLLSTVLPAPALSLGRRRRRPRRGALAVGLYG